MVRHERRVPREERRASGDRRRRWTGAVAALLAAAAGLPLAPRATAAVPSVCNVAPNGSFEDPNIEGNPNSFYVNGYASYLTNQATISGWSVVSGTVDILRWFSDASDGAQSIDMWGTAPGVIEQTFSDLTPGASYTFSIDYAGLSTTGSVATVSLNAGSGFAPVQTLMPVAASVPGGTPPAQPQFDSTWATFAHTFTATAPSATIRIANQVAPGPLNTGLFVDNFVMNGPCIDYGDAPSSYGSQEADDGPRHLLDEYDIGTHTAPLTLGATVDGEADGPFAGGGIADDDTDVGDEDGVSSPIAYAIGTPETVDVAYTNDTGASATLAGWVDLDRSGTFDAGELQTVVVPTGTGVVQLTFPALSGAGDTYARLRLFPGTVATPLPTGEVLGGEVEDYRVAGPPTVLTCDAVPNGSFEEPNIQGNPDAFEYPPGTASFLTNQGTISGWNVVAGSVDILRAYANASDGAQSIDLWGVSAGTIEQRFTGLIPGVSYTISLDYSGLSTTGSRGTISLDTGSGPTDLQVLAPAADAVLTAVPPPAYTVTWSTFTHTFIATTPDATIRITNQVAPGPNNTGLFLDNFEMTGSSCDDFGDAAGTYGTTSAQNGPSHRLSGYDAATNTGPLMLGGLIDADPDGSPTAAASGDDAAFDDEDAFSGPISIAPGVSTFTLTVPVTNTTGGPATLYAWIDANNNGSFQAGELASATVAAGATSANLTWSGLPALLDGTTPTVRFRLTTSALTDNPATTGVDERALGAAADGEVEDHPALVATSFPLTCATPFVETFGAGAGRGPALPTGQTTYIYDPTGPVVDGLYTIIDNPASTGGFWWHTGADHTPGDANGRMMLVNANPTPGLFFQRTFTRLVAGGLYDFSAWITNANNIGSFFAPNITFRVVNPATGAVLASANTGDIPNAASLIWNRYGLQFTAATTTVRLEMVNNQQGGNGNDLALDDISFAQVCEFGDAPDSYGTTLANGGPGHISGGPTLGTARDTENNGQPSVGASADDTNGATPDDEDGVSAPITMTPTVSPSVSVSVTNTSAVPVTLAGWIDLDGNGAFEPAERVTTTIPAGSGTANYPLNFPVPTTTANTYARFRVYSEVIADPSPVGIAAGGEVEDYPVTMQLPRLQIDKTSDASVDVRPGGLVEYTITATNVGTGAFTATNPAMVVDDLSGVLDDAAYNGDAAANRAPLVPDVAMPQIAWVGALAAGDSVTITYSVTVAGGGDGTVRNVAFQPTCDPSDPGCTPVPPTSCVNGVDPATQLPCDELVSLLPKLTIDKSASTTALPALGDPVTYTVTITNAGPGVYTDAAPAAFTDDLTAVIDDTSDPSGFTWTAGNQPIFSSPNLSWTGALAAGQAATITYTVVYDGLGDQLLVNSACVPASEAQDPDNPCDAVQVPAGAIVQTKTVDPASGSAVDAGDVLTYTLTFENIGQAPATVDTTDDLTGVLDDAVLTGPIVAEAGLTAVPNGSGIDIDGTVPVGETLTVTYTVTVAPFAAQGDHVLRNALACQAGSPPGCAPERTENPVRQLRIVKTSDAAASSGPGDPITYTVTATSIGTGDYTVGEPAIVVDDLSAVLDDGTYPGDAAADRDPAIPSYTEPQLSWVGALPAGESVTMTYTVTLDGGGDGTVRNVAFQSPCDPTDPLCDPVPPAQCVDGLDPATGLPCDDVVVLLPKLTIDKQASATTLQLGDPLTYTVTVRNEGPGDYTAAHRARFEDDLSGVLDDTTLPANLTATIGTASFVAPDTLAWNGVLTAGQHAEVTYTVVYTATGDHLVTNAACVPLAEAQDQTEDCDAVTVTGANLIQSKTVDPASGTAVDVGDLVTYTLSFQNTGAAPATVATTDDAGGVLDDATLVAGPTSSDPGNLSATLNGSVIEIAGSVPAGQTITVTYTVVVEPFADQGDHVLANVLACPQASPPGCVPATTENPIRHLSITKSSNAAAGVDTGDTITYTLRITNVGAGDYTGAEPARASDDLSEVVDDAIFNGDATADIGVPTYSAPTLSWSGALAAGDVATITYSVTVTNLGDHTLTNTASITGCVAPDDGCFPPSVVIPLPHVVPTKTSTPASGAGLRAGDVITYTLSWSNDGQAPGVVDATDDLTDIIDDGTVTSEPVSPHPAVTVSRNGAQIRVVGAIAAGATVTITYQVTIKPDGQRGNNVARNVLTPDTPQVTCDGGCQPVDPPTTQHPIGELDDWKTVTPASGMSVQAGATATYTLHFANTGQAPVQVDRDDVIAGVLDDATLAGAPTSSSPALTVSAVTNGRFTISGTVAAGQEETVTYSVTVNADGARGDDRLGNFLVEPGATPPAECTPLNPARPDCTTTPVTSVQVVKSSNPASGTTVEPGGQITYTLAFTNTSTAGTATVDHNDHMADVVDDATVTAGPTASDAALNATFDGSIIHVAGQLAPGETATITYSVTLKPYAEQGNHQLNNVVALAGQPPVCAPGSGLCTTHVANQAITPPPPPPASTPSTTPQPGELPATGGNRTPLLQLTVLFAGLGLVLLTVSRRRRRPVH